MPNDVPAVFCDTIYISLLFKLRVEENLLFHDTGTLIDRLLVILVGHCNFYYAHSPFPFPDDPFLVFKVAVQLQLNRMSFSVFGCKQMNFKLISKALERGSIFYMLRYVIPLIGCGKLQ